MTIQFCPHCNERIVVGFDTTDFIHECNSGNDIVDQEDVLVVGDWEDYTGTGVKSPQDVLRQGMSNELQGKRAAIEGYNKDAITRRGANALTHRQRQHLEFVQIKEPVRKER